MTTSLPNSPFASRVWAISAPKSVAVAACFVCSIAAAEEVPQDQGIEEVIVTGEKLNRSLKDTATSVTVLTSDAINTRAGLDGLEDVLGRLANTTDTGDGLVPTVRGVDGTGPQSGGTAFFAGTRTRLNLQVDGRPLSFNEAAYGNATLYDVQQVEILRGPQSTLQGRNSIAGTVAIKTNDPTFDFEGGMRLAGGSDNFRQGAGFLSGPVIEDQLAVRLAADYQKRDSFLDMQPWAGHSDPERFEMLTLRGKALMRPKALENFEALLTLNYSESRAPQVEFLNYPYDQDESASVPTFGSSEPVFQMHALASILSTRWKAAENTSFESTLSYTDYGMRRFVIPGTGNAQLAGSEVIVEPRLRTKLLGGRLDLMSGVFFYDADQSEMINFFLESHYEDRTRTYAAFTEGRFAATDRLSLMFGGRYEKEKRTRFSTQALFPIDFEKTFNAFLPKFGVSYAVTDATTVGAIASRGYNGGGAGLILSFPVQNYVYDAEFVWTYEAYVRSNVSNRLSLAANAFYSDYNNMQVSFDTDPSAAYAILVINLHDVKVHGADIGIHCAPTDATELFAEIGLLDTKIHTNTLLDGQELSRAPKLTSTLGASYRAPWGLQFSIDARYSADYFSREINLAQEKVPSYWVANAKLAYNLREKAQIFLSSTNLFDTRARTYLYSGLGPQPVASIVRPRTINAGISVNF